MCNINNFTRLYHYDTDNRVTHMKCYKESNGEKLYSIHYNLCTVTQIKMQTLSFITETFAYLGLKKYLVFSRNFCCMEYYIRFNL